MLNISIETITKKDMLYIIGLLLLLNISNVNSFISKHLLKIKFKKMKKKSLVLTCEEHTIADKQ